MKFLKEQGLLKEGGKEAEGIAAKSPRDKDGAASVSSFGSFLRRSDNRK